MVRPLEHLTKFHRRATPFPLCEYLVNRIMAEFGCDRVAVLWVEAKSHYWRLWPKVDMWGRGRDARTYNGPYPVICHPPCGPWGKYKAKAHESKEHGIIAMELVHRWGGVVEHPIGSSLFADHGKGGTIEIIDQIDYGHMARKRTILYYVSPTTRR